VETTQLAQICAGREMKMAGEKLNILPGPRSIVRFLWNAQDTAGATKMNHPIGGSLSSLNTLGKIKDL